MLEGNDPLPPVRRQYALLAARLAVFLTAGTQVLVLPTFLFPFVTPRNVFFRICVELALSCILIAGVKRLREIQGAVDPILKWFGIFLLALSLAAVFGLSPWHSMFGDFERMGGVFAWLHLFVFFVVLRIVMRGEDWLILFRAIVAVADAIVLWGAAEFLPATIRNPRSHLVLSEGSSTGNPGLLGPYLLLCIALCTWLLVAERARVWKALAAISEVTLLVGLAGARNRSSQLGLVVGFIIGIAVFLFLHSERRRVIKRYSLPVLAAFAALLGGAYGLSLVAPRITDQFSGKWRSFFSSPVDRSRTVEWKIGADGFRERPILGYGPENHQIIVSHHFDPAVYSIGAGGIFDRTHNAWIELLATSGVVGFLSMLGLWTAAVAMIRTGVRRNSLRPWEAGLFTGALAGYAVYLTFWFFDINAALVWVVILAFLSFRVLGPIDALVNNLESAEELAFKALKPITTWAFVALIALAAYLHGIVPLVAAHNLSIAASSGRFGDRLTKFQRVMNSPAPQTLHTLPLYFEFLRNTRRFAESPSSDPLIRKGYDLALQRGMIESYRHISRSREDDRSYVEAARVAMLGSTFYGDVRYLRIAKSELLDAVRISPRRPDARVLLSGVYLTLRDTAPAAAQLDTAMRLTSHFSGAFAFASRLELARGRVDSSAKLLELAIAAFGALPESIVRNEIDSLVSHGENARAAKISQLYLADLFGSESTWSESRAAFSANPFAVEIAEKLPILYLNAGENSLAARAAKNLAVLEPAAREPVAQFLADLESGRSAQWKTRGRLSQGGVSPFGESSARSR